MHKYMEHAQLNISLKRKALLKYVEVETIHINAYDSILQ